MKKLITLMTMLILLTCVLMANAAETIVSANKDTYVCSFYKVDDKNYGSESKLEMYSYQNYCRRMFVGFNVEGCPEVDNVESVKLYLYQDQLGRVTRRLDAHFERITETWSETSVTWNDQPSATTTHRYTHTMPIHNDYPAYTRVWREYDITQLYKDNSSNDFGVRIRYTPENAYPSIQLILEAKNIPQVMLPILRLPMMTVIKEI